MDRDRRRLVAGGVLLLIMGGAGFLLNFLAPSFAYADSDAKAFSVDKSIVAANTDFAVRLMKELQSKQKGKNIFISPLSVSIALTMTYNGANASTRAAMRSTLGLEDMSDDEINAGFSQLIESLLGADNASCFEYR